MSARLRVLVLMLTDAACMFGVWAFDVWAYHAIGIGRYRFGWEYFLRLWPALVAFILINAAFRLYHGNALYPSAPVSPVEELRRLVFSALLTHLGLVAYLALTHQTVKETSRVVTVSSGVLTAVLAQPLRNLVRWLLWKTHTGRIPAVIAGPWSVAERVSAAFARDPYFGFATTGIAEGEAVLNLADRADTLVSCEDDATFHAAYPKYAQAFTHIIYLPVVSAFPVAAARPVSCDGMGGLVMTSQCRMLALCAWKRFLDLLLTLLAFVLLSPVFAVIAVLVLATSRGSVFTRHERLGRGGRPFRVLKFRTTYVDAEERLRRVLERDAAKRAEWQARGRLADDPRVTPLGRFLRKTALDELPQFINVFTGDMALVGPRPITEKEVAHCGAAYATVSSVRPGVTGLWQVSGCRNADYARRVALDVHYVLNWSPWMDVWILLRTAGSVLFMTDSPDVRLVVAAHKAYRMPEGEAFLPLQVGAAGKASIGYVRDDIGENISARNANYCELTGLYWAWKNLDAEAVGLVHYRRLFRASPRELATALETHDIVLPQMRHYYIETNYSQYVHAHHAEDLATTRAILAERHPEYLGTYDAVMQRTSGHRFNMFVMRRATLDRYCTWLFGILFELERRLDISAYSQNDARVFGFVAERLLDVWIEQNGISYAEFPVRNLESQHWPRKIYNFLKRKMKGGGAK